MIIRRFIGCGPDLVRAAWRVGAALTGVAAALVFTPGSVRAADAESCADHPSVGRYPASALEWCRTENFAEYAVPAGPVAGYRTIGEVDAVEGRLTRNFYSIVGERTHAEVYANFRDALVEGGFEIIASGLDPQVRGDVGGRGWLGAFVALNPSGDVSGAPVSKLASGTATQGGAGAIVAKKSRAEDTIYAVVVVEQHSATEVAYLVDVVETKAVETGLVTADAEAMGADIEELGRTVLEGLYFEFDKATLKPESAPALAEIAKYLKGVDGSFFCRWPHRRRRGVRLQPETVRRQGDGCAGGAGGEPPDRTRPAGGSWRRAAGARLLERLRRRPREESPRRAGVQIGCGEKAT